MSDGIGSVRTLKRKNVKGLALAAPAPRTVAPSESDLQIPGGNSSENARQTAQLEIGIEYKLDLKREDLEVLKDLGHGNGGTVSKVRHMATGTIMARKVSGIYLHWHEVEIETYSDLFFSRSSMSRPKKRCAVGLSGNCRSCTIPTQNLLSTSTALF
jgi:hypothetical protein